MLQADKPSDYVLATGVGATVQDFAAAAFASLELNWRDHVQVDASYVRPAEVDVLIGDASHAKSALGWTPQTMWKDVAQLMAQADWQAVNDQLSGLRVRIDR